MDPLASEVSVSPYVISAPPGCQPQPNPLGKFVVPKLLKPDLRDGIRCSKR